MSAAPTLSGIDAFTYLGFDADPRTGSVDCRYRLGPFEFCEQVTVDVPTGGAVDAAAFAEAARLVALLLGVSYYKAAAPPVVDLGPVPVRPGDVEFLRSFYVDGLGEYAYRNGIDLSGVQIRAEAVAPAPVPFAPSAGPLIPFGGGIDSIVSVEAARAVAGRSEPALFVMSRAGDRFAAIETALGATGLGVLRAERALDPQILRSAELGFRNGHVPVTGMLSAIAVLCAVANGRDAVVMSNEWSASSGNVVVDGREVNHQFSKSLAFESSFRSVLAGAFVHPPDYFSLLRSRSELWIARRFAALRGYHHIFRSCNRAFQLDPAARLDHWCGTCDKCCFIDLILAPFVERAELSSVFGGAEPLDDPARAEQFRALLELSDDVKPFECVGEVGECRAALVLAAQRADRSDLSSPLLHALVAELGPDVVARAQAAVPALLEVLGPDHVPADFAAALAAEAQ